MARAQSTDFYSIMRFQVVDNGTTDHLNKAAGFNSVTMPEYTLDIAEYSEGVWTYRRKFPGIPTVSDVTMTRGVAKQDTLFFAWVLAGIVGDEYRTDFTIEHFARTDVAGLTDYTTATPSRTIQCFEALPMRVKPGSDFDALSSDISIQELDVAVEQLALTSN